eukprot:GEMP01026121.1.p1 GENE.GEMP01026121.1~~GEMP01026121.1.p1  ORF type:complete len:457 (+),score=150.71 GEMP01026121.1:142-1512(+)
MSADAKVEKRVPMRSSVVDVMRDKIFAKALPPAHVEQLRAFSEFMVNRFAKRGLRAANEEVFKKVAEELWKVTDARKTGKATAVEFHRGTKSLGYVDSEAQRIFALLDDGAIGYILIREFVRKMKNWLARAKSELPPQGNTPPAESANDANRAPVKLVDPPQVPIMAELRQLESKYLSLCNSAKDQAEKSITLTADLTVAKATVLRLTQESNSAEEKSADWATKFEQANKARAQLEQMLAGHVEFERRRLRAQGTELEEDRQIQRVVKTYGRRLRDASPLLASPLLVPEPQVVEPQVPPIRRRTQETSDAEVERRKLRKQVAETEEWLEKETKRRELAESAELQTQRKLEMLEDMLARSIDKEQYWKEQNRTLKKSVEYMSDMLNRQREASELQAGKQKPTIPQARHRQSRYSPNKPLRKLLRLEGILPRAVRFKAMRYAEFSDDETLSPISSRLP